jgi:hypothetical protein
MRARPLAPVGALLALAAGCGPPADGTDLRDHLRAPVQRAQVAGGDWQARLPSFARYDAGEVVERWLAPGGDFAVHFSRKGRNQVPGADGEGDGVPDLVQVVGATLEGALAVYRDRLGLRAPLASTDGTRTALDVFMVDFAGRGDGNFQQEACRPGPPRACSGLLLMENDFVGYRYGGAAVGARIVASHELFHAVQAAYDRPEDVVLSEATATWGTEAFEPALTDFERAIPGYLNTPEQPLGISPAGPVPPFAYGSALFFQYLSERFGERTIAAIYEALERPASDGPAGAANPGPWLPVVATVLERQRATPFAAAFAEFARWNAVTGAATTAPTYEAAAGYPRVATRPPPPATEPVRLFAATAQYLTLPAAPLRAALAGIPAAAPVELAAFGEASGQLAELGRAPRELQIEPPAGATGLRLVVSHGAAMGSASRPTLCLGTAAEVAACVAAAPGSTPPTPDAGPSPMPATDDGGGCQIGAPGRRGGDAGALGVVLALLGIARAATRGAWAASSGPGGRRRRPAGPRPRRP